MHDQGGHCLVAVAADRDRAVVIVDGFNYTDPSMNVEIAKRRLVDPDSDRLRPQMMAAKQRAHLPVAGRFDGRAPVRSAGPSEGLNCPKWFARLQVNRLTRQTGSFGRDQMRDVPCHLFS
jgi:hypothetical protein